MDSSNGNNSDDGDNQDLKDNGHGDDNRNDNKVLPYPFDDEGCCNERRWDESKVTLGGYPTISTNRNLESPVDVPPVTPAIFPHNNKATAARDQNDSVNEPNPAEKLAWVCIPQLTNTILA